MYYELNTRLHDYILFREMYMTFHAPHTRLLLLVRSLVPSSSSSSSSWEGTMASFDGLQLLYNYRMQLSRPTRAKCPKKVLYLSIPFYYMRPPLAGELGIIYHLVIIPELHSFLYHDV